MWVVYFTQMIIMPQGCNTSLLLATQEHNGIIINGRSRIECCPDMEKWAYLSFYKAFKYAEWMAEPKASRSKHSPRSLARHPWYKDAMAVLAHNTWAPNMHAGQGSEKLDDDIGRRQSPLSSVPITSFTPSVNYCGFCLKA